MAMKRGKKYLPPVMLIAALVLALGLELLFRHYAVYIRSFSDNVILYKKEFVERQKNLRYDALLMGDSRVMGVDARLLSDALTQAKGRDFVVYNFALPNHDVRGHYLFLKKYLVRHQPPPVILFSAAPPTWGADWNIRRQTRRMSAEVHRFCLLYSWGEAWSSLPLQLWPRIVLAKLERLSFLLTYRQSIQYFLQHIRQRRILPPVKDLVLGRNGGVNFGTGIPPAETEVMASDYYQKVFAEDEDSVAWLERFFELAWEHDIKVICFNAPLPQIIFADRASDLRRYEQTLQRITAKHPNVLLLTPIVEGYDLHYFRDVQHLNGPGFKIFSMELARRLAAVLP